MSDTPLNEYETRLQRLKQLKSAGVIPYANKYNKKHAISDLIAVSSDTYADADILMSEGATPVYSTAGRMMSFRTMGKLSFATLRDATGDIQICFVKGLCKFYTGRDVVTEIEIAGQEINTYKLAEKFLDIGDFVGVTGELFVTKHGELTIFVDTYQLLSKALRPLGDKRHGIQDEEKKYRKRYLDMTMNQESYERFQLRSQFLKALREFYRKEQFVEIDTPILGNSASGAAAAPFTTHHHDFDTDVFLRIAPEIALKMATVGRFEKVFEIGRNFRNEGSDPSHMQEFTVVEHYAVYRNYEDNMRFMEELFDYIFDQLGLDPVIPIKDKQGKIRKVDRSTPRERIDYIQGVHKESGIDISTYGPDDADTLRQDIKNAGHSREGMDEQATATLIDYLYKKVMRPKIVGPAFVYNYPKTMQPLARQSDDDAEIVEQFQVVVNGREICKAYSELVDPIIQVQNFEEQSDAVDAGDDEATRGDDDFVLSMEHGMPCQSGFGMGIERVVALLTQQDNLRDVFMFPLMKPQHKASEESDEGQMKSDEASGQANSDALGTGTSNISNAIERSYEGLPSIDQAHTLVDKYLTDTRRHCEQVGQVMRYFAQQLGEDEGIWYMAGLLHDIDRDHIAKDAGRHLKDEFDAMMDEIDMPQALRDDIKSHGEWLTGVPVDSLIRKYLASVDELSGFIYAYSLMRPTGMEGMKAKSIKKKIKDKAFAKGVDRVHLKHCEVYLDMSLDEFVPQVIEAMQS